MKRIGKRLLCSILTVCMLSCLLCTFASARSSMYLDAYRATLTARSGGRIIVTVDVAGVGTMDEIGATNIFIYESTDNATFTQVASYSSDDYPEMLTSGTTTYYDSPITYYGTPGRYYKASVYCYAGKDGGGDTRQYMTASKVAIP